MTDYVRLYALYEEGGIYLDTDVYVKKTFDVFLMDRFFTSIEYHPEMIESDELV
ncbi:MAG: glycosyltransferase [Parabacteroides merdae]